MVLYVMMINSGPQRYHSWLGSEFDVGQCRHLVECISIAGWNINMSGHVDHATFQDIVLNVVIGMAVLLQLIPPYSLRFF